MKKTLQKTAREYADSVINSFGINGVPNGISDIKEMLALAFKNGAEWQSKQSPWISVKEKVGCDSSNDCIVMDSDGEVFRACFSPENKWLKYNRGYYVIDNVTHWLPIPSFDETLEANKDALKQIKEKGD